MGINLASLGSCLVRITDTFVVLESPPGLNFGHSKPTRGNDLGRWKQRT